MKSLHLLQKTKTKKKINKKLVVLVSLPNGQSPDMLITMEVQFIRGAVGESEWCVLLNLLNRAFKEEHQYS